MDNSMNNQVKLYHTSHRSAFERNDIYRLGRIFDACVECKAFVVGYNVLEVVNGEDRVLLALALKDDINTKEKFEQMTYLDLIPVEEGETNGVEYQHNRSGVCNMSRK